MTKLAEAGYTCPACGHEGKSTLYESVNVTLEPELKERVLDFSLFAKECEDCGEFLGHPENLVYHDMDQRLMLFVKPPELRDRWEELSKEILKPFGDIAKIVPDADFEGYEFRLCFGFNELIEKIGIFDFGLDDGFVEILKTVLISKREDKSLRESYSMYFGTVTDEGGWSFAILDERTGEITESYEIPQELIESFPPETRLALPNICDGVYVNYRLGLAEPAEG